MTIYITLLLCGLLLIGMEIFVPGGILGLVGAGALIGAAVLGFTHDGFPEWFGWISLLMILVLTGVAMFIWIKFIPQSPIGRALSLKANTPEDDVSEWETGMTGTTLCELRPSGKAMINEKRTDVIADKGSWIENNMHIEITKISGNRIYVKEAHAE